MHTAWATLTNWSLNRPSDITITAEKRALWETRPEEVEKAIRAARRQVQRYGQEAVDGLMSWCADDDERALVARALSTNTRVSTILREWEARTRS